MPHLHIVLVQSHARLRGGVDVGGLDLVVVPEANIFPAEAAADASPTAAAYVCQPCVGQQAGSSPGAGYRPGPIRSDTIECEGRNRGLARSVWRVQPGNRRGLASGGASGEDSLVCNNEKNRGVLGAAHNAKRSKNCQCGNCAGCHYPTVQPEGALPQRRHDAERVSASGAPTPSPFCAVRRHSCLHAACFQCHAGRTRSFCSRG